DERGHLPRRGLDGEVEFLAPRVAFGVVFAVDGFVVAPGQQDEAGGERECACGDGHDAAWSSSSALSFSTSVRRYSLPPPLPTPTITAVILRSFFGSAGFDQRHSVERSTPSMSAAT